MGAIFNPNTNVIYLPHRTVLEPEKINPLVLHEIRHVYVASDLLHDFRGLLRAEAFGDGEGSVSQLPTSETLDDQGYAVSQNLEEVLAYQTQVQAHRARYREARRRKWGLERQYQREEFRRIREFGLEIGKRNFRGLHQAEQVVREARKGNKDARARIRLLSFAKYTRASIRVESGGKVYFVYIHFALPETSEALEPRLVQSRLAALEDRLRRTRLLNARTSRSLKNLKL